MSSPHATPTVGVPDLPPPAGTALRQRLGRLGPLFLLFNFGWSTTNNAAGNYLQAAAATISPHDKLGFYTAAATVGALLAAIAIIVAGGLSDRTRSRFGRRVPWIAGGSVVAAAGLLLTGVTTSPVLVIIGWAVFQMALNTMVAAALAITPDLLAERIYGRASGILGVGLLLGSVSGGILTSLFITTPQRGLMVVPWIMLVISIMVAAFLPRASSRDQPRERGGLLGFLRSLRPPKDPQFWWVFTGRFLFILALYMVVLYEFFIATDFLHLTDQKAGDLIAIGSIILAVTAGTATAVAGPLSDRVGRKPFVIGAPVLTAIALVPLAVLHTEWAFLLFFGLGGLAYGSYISVDAALMVDILPDKERAAKDLAILNASNTLPAVFAPAVAGGLVSLGGYPLSFVGVGVACIAGALAILRVRRVR